MAENTTGLRAVLSKSEAYSFLQDLLGAKQARKRFVTEYIKPYPKMRLLDIGCGPGEMLDALEDVEYVGVDHSENYIETAKKKYLNRGKFFCTDINSFSENEPKFDCATAFGVLHHLDDSQVEALLQSLSKWVKKGGKLVTYDPVFTDDMAFIARQLVSRDRGRNVRTESSLLKLLTKHFSKVQTIVHHDFLRIPYSNIVAVCEI